MEFKSRRSYMRVTGVFCVVSAVLAIHNYELGFGTFLSTVHTVLVGLALIVGPMTFAVSFKEIYKD